MPQQKTVPTVQITPTLAQLPVFVRAGSILPIAPLTQSTNELPKGPLTLRIYAGNPCRGELYLDDGKSYAFEHGEYLRIQFSCEMTNDGLRVRIGTHDGAHPAWWKQIKAEVYGWKPAKGVVVMDAAKTPLLLTQEANGFSFEIVDDGKGAEILVQ
jgi:alpha-glucosidase